jgi:hypothetical protein
VTSSTSVVTSSDSGNKSIFHVSEEKVSTVKEGTVTLLRLRGIAGVPWMNQEIYAGFTDLLKGPFDPETMSSWTEGVYSACFWEKWTIFAGLK